jgi:tetratricopeptide (TPR) repeat protein
MMSSRFTILAMVAFILGGMISGCGQQSTDITFTTSSPDAKAIFMDGLAKFEMLKFDEAREMFAEAVEADSAFAMAYYYWALSSATTSDFEERLNKAVELSGNVTEPERLVIMSAKANNDDNAALAREKLEQLVKLLPEGKRAHALLGNFYYGQQEWALAEAEYVRVTEIDSTYAPVYNQLGYLFSNLERYGEAIEALQKYAELRPEDPNPHDSMGEIYLWMGDYDNSIAEYGKSLELDPNFVISIAGIGHNYVFQGQYEKARAKYKEILVHANSVADTITSSLWVAVSYVYENKYDKAIEVMKERLEFVEVHNNPFQMAAINGQLSFISEEMGDLDAALEYAAKVREIASRPEIGEGNREAYDRFAMQNEVLIFARRGDMDMTNAKIAEFEKSAEASQNKIALLNVHGLKGLAAYWNEDYPGAAEELRQADPQNQYQRYYLALALEEEGETDEAETLFEEIAGFNRNSLNYAFVRPAAMKKM